MRTIRVYKSYSFREKDPVIDVVRTIVEDSHRTYTSIHEDSGVATTTLSNWFYGKTRRPQFATIAAVARACGKDIAIGGVEVKPKRRRNGK